MTKNITVKEPVSKPVPSDTSTNGEKSTSIEQEIPAIVKSKTVSKSKGLQKSVSAAVKEKPIAALKAKPFKDGHKENTIINEEEKAAKIKASVESREKAKKIKLIRDSFTMPETEYEVLGEVKKVCLKAGFEIKKSELLRIGVSLIRTIEPAGLKEILDALPLLKAGRPKKEK
jgi:hypothetical protein